MFAHPNLQPKQLLSWRRHGSARISHRTESLPVMVHRSLFYRVGPETAKLLDLILMTATSPCVQNGDDFDWRMKTQVCWWVCATWCTHSWHCILSWRHNQFSWSQVAAVIQSVWLMPWHWVILLRLYMVNDAHWLVMKAWTVIFATSSTRDLHTVFICHRWQQLLLDRRSPCGLKVNTQSSYTLWHIGSLYLLLKPKFTTSVWNHVLIQTAKNQF